ncbi:MAG: hypothetical protein ACYTFH_05045 [Planctomycetota bacterium]|jgi:hypothetical protein
MTTTIRTFTIRSGTGPHTGPGVSGPGAAAFRPSPLASLGLILAAIVAIPVAILLIAMAIALFIVLAVVLTLRRLWTGLVGGLSRRPDETMAGGMAGTDPEGRVNVRVRRPDA